MKLLNTSWLLLPVAPFLVALLVSGGWDALMCSWEGWAMLGVFVLMILAKIPITKLLYFNHKQ